FEYIGDNVESKWDIPAFVTGVLDNKSNAFDYLIRKPNINLTVLSILCFGYLISHGGSGLTNPEWWRKYYQEIDENLKAEAQDGKDKFQLESMSDTEKPVWWKRIAESEQILREISELKDEGSDKWKAAFTALVNYVKKDGTLDTHELDHKVKAAYDAFGEFENNKTRYL
ncbi:MAG: hypothetical protein L7F78_11935, partial [Syntrophales bacterium LBB04]|nr:hypothetical protein [Syntrophales bacterium LBB04]